MNPNIIKNLSANQADDKSHAQNQKKEDKTICILKEQNIDPQYSKETREEKDIPFLEEMEEKKLTQEIEHEHKEQSEVSTLIAKEEKVEPKQNDSSKEILYTCSKSESSDPDSLFQKINLIPYISQLSSKESQHTENKYEIQNMFLNKKTKKESPVNKNVNKNLKIKSDDEDSDNLHFDNNPRGYDVYIQIYGEEETDEEKTEIPISNEYQNDLDFNKENAIVDFISSLFEKENDLNENENDEKFNSEKFKGILCNKKFYNKGIINDEEINEERINSTSYALLSVEDNPSTYYKSKI